MNWGFKIIIAYSIFVGGILYLVVRASGEKFDMVEPDYYQAELKFQQRIDQEKRTAALSAPPTINLIPSHQIKIGFPEELKGKQLTGEALLYSPSDENKDVKIPFQCTDSLLISMPEKMRGYYHLKLEWSTDEKSFYYTEKLLL